MPVPTATEMSSICREGQRGGESVLPQLGDKDAVDNII